MPRLLGLVLCASFALAVVCAPASAALRAGAAVADFTPPNGGTTLGFVRPDIQVVGVHTRLQARVLVIADGDTKVALLSTDLAFPLEKDSLVARVKDLGYGHDTILYTGTHTHSGPGDLSAWQVAQIAKAIRTADAKLRPAVAAWSGERVEGVNRNRSVEAHLANHGMDHFYGQGRLEDDPRGAGHAVDERLRVLRVQGTDGRPIAAWMNYPVHLTASTPAANLWDSDLAAPARLHLEDAVGTEDFVALYNNGNLGDLMPRFDAFNPTAVMELHGLRIAEGAWVAWQEAGRRLSGTLPVDVRWTRVCYCGQEVEPGGRVDSKPIWGLAFFGGSEDGASIFHEPLSTEGRRHSAGEADPVQGRKIQVAPGLVHEGNPEVHAIRIGDKVMLGAPGEPSVEMGRRLEAAARSHLPRGTSEAFVVSLANDYMGYLVTPEEYEMQHYEGGHTVFGTRTSLLVRNAFGDLLDAMAAGRPAPEPSEPAALGSAEEAAPAVGNGATKGTIDVQPDASVERMGIVTVGWRGAADGVDRPADKPFITLERFEGGVWHPADTDLGLSFIWTESQGAYRARYDVPRQVEPGVHRLRITSGAYDLTTREFKLAPSDDIRVLGATVRRRRGRTHLVIKAQYPPPDASRAIRWRPVSPSGGTARVRVGKRRYTARWNGSEGGWRVRTKRRIRAGAAVVVSRLADRWGNRAAGSATVRAGMVEDIQWPPNMGVGGGRTPGPFGQGEFPP